MKEEWMYIILLFLANAGLILWFRAEARNDWRHLDTKIDAHSKETRELIEAIKQDMKDFHGRLCAIEERRRDK